MKNRKYLTFANVFDNECKRQSSWAYHVQLNITSFRHLSFRTNDYRF